jgi:hypothetical protein
MKTSEQLALELASDRKALLAELREASRMLNGRYHKFFQRKHQRFDFDNKRLYGFDGFFLQWQLRHNPDAPESYENQQTSVGTVTLDRERTNPHES